MNQMPYSYMPNMQNPYMMPPFANTEEKIEELQERINHLERQVRRLENKVFHDDSQNYDYSKSPPKDSGMYMM